jgi:RNA polymerase sigma-70 factor (ECF subfamily)
MTEYDELDRLKAAVSGDRSALAQILIQHAPRLTSRIGRRLALNPFADFGVEDVLQEVFIDVLQGIGTFQLEQSLLFAAWIDRVADNRLVEMLRFRNREKRGGQFRRRQIAGLSGSVREIVAQLSDHREATGSERVQRADMVRTLETELARLPEAQKMAVKHHYIDQHPMDSTAREMQTTPGAVRGLLFRAKHALRNALGQSSRWFKRK